MKNKPKIILFDDKCSFCRYCVLLIMNIDREQKIRFISLWSKKGKSLLKKCNIKKQSLVFIENKKCFAKSSAVLQISKNLKFPCKLFYGFVLIPRKIRDFIYNEISKRRHLIMRNKSLHEYPFKNCFC